MTLGTETINFLMFIVIGMIFSIIFDFFRAIRKFKKVSNNVIYVQDVLYFIIIGIILLGMIIGVAQDSFRIYLVIAIILGVIIYISVLGNAVMKLFLLLFKFSNEIFKFVFIPITPYLQIFDKQINILKKFVVNCCKKILYMVNFYYHKMKSVQPRKNKLKTKEGIDKCQKQKNKLLKRILKRSTG